MQTEKQLRSTARRASLQAYHGGGGPVTKAVFQRAGAFVGAAAARRGLQPTHLTLISLFLSISGSIILFLETPLALVLAWALWQAAYVFDCSDGQLARYLSVASQDGKKLDASVDLFGHALSGIAVASVSVGVGVSPHIVYAFAATRLVSTSLASFTARSAPNQPSLARNILKSPLDYPVQSTAVIMALATNEDVLATIVLATFTTLAFAQLARAILVSSRSALRQASPR